MFAKILDSKMYGQILVTKDYSTEDDSATVKVQFEFESMYVKTSIGTGSEEAQDEIFNSFDLEKAENFISEILP